MAGPVVTGKDVIASFGTYWRSRTDAKLIASVRKLSDAGIELLEMGGDDPQAALTYWHQRPKQAARVWHFGSEAELQKDWERVERGWIAVDDLDAGGHIIIQFEGERAERLCETTRALQGAVLQTKPSDATCEDCLARVDIE